MPLLRTTHPRFDAIICDIDGCLSPETSEPFDLAALAHIAEYNRLAQQHRDRPVLTLCSGRPQPFAEAMARLTQNKTLPLIAENGVWMYIPGENIYELDPAITPEQRRAVRDAAAWLDDEFGSRGVSQQPGKSASVSLYHPDTEYLKSICDPIRAEFAQRNWPMRVSMTWFYVNCDLAHINKATGIARLIKRTGLDRQRLAGIGDTLSDVPIRESVSWFACPANAAPEMQARADYVAKEHEAQGVMEILKNLPC